MTGQFYYDVRSPQVRSVLFVIEALDIDIERVPIDLFKGEHKSPEFLKVNPLHTVPAYRDDKVTLTDSHSIAIYLCGKYADKSKQIWPTEPVERINVLNKLFYSGTVLFRRDSDAIGGIINKKLSKEQLEEHLTLVHDQYNVLEQFLTQNVFIATDNLTIADFAVVAIVSTLDMLVPVAAKSWPKLHTWWNKIKELPYYEKVNRDGLNHLKQIVQKFTDFQINFE